MKRVSSPTLLHRQKGDWDCGTKSLSVSAIGLTPDVDGLVWRSYSRGCSKRLLGAETDDMPIPEPLPDSSSLSSDPTSLGIVMNGVTGRMGTNQHLVRSILAIRNDGGLRLRNGTVVMPEPFLVGRDEAKVRALAKRFEIDRWSTDLSEALSEPGFPVYFDAQATAARAAAVRSAIESGKHIYSEKPTTGDLESTLSLARAAREVGVKTGVVQDKLFLPGLTKLRRLVESGFFGRILSVRGEFGYWVFEGPEPPAQRPSWNYRAEDGGGIILDMFAHWRYVLDLFGGVRSVFACGANHIPERFDETGTKYASTAEDAAYGIFVLEGDAVAQINSSWCTRVDRGELLELHVDGTAGSAVAGLHDCRIQPSVATPRAVWNPDVPNEIDYRASWQAVPALESTINAFRVQWEMFLGHVVADEPFQWDFLAGARGIQLAELGVRSWREGRVLDVPELSL
jgi:predicted dehydrogenase